MKTIEYSDFIEEYKPVKNHIDGDAAFDGYMFETYGEELEYVTSQKQDKIWTIMDSESEEGIDIVSGYHVVNRLGYLITNKAFNEEVLVKDEY